MNSKINASIVGFAIGEAFGLPLNYERKEKLINKPVTKMIKCENLNIPIGTWSSGTSTILATIDAIITKEKVDYNKIADNLLLWYKIALPFFCLLSLCPHPLLKEGQIMSFFGKSYVAIIV